MLTNYLKVAIKVLGRRKFYTAVNLFGIAFTLLILVLCTAMLDTALAPSKPETRLDRILGIDRAMLSGPRRSISSGPGYRLLDSYARDLPGVESFSIASGTSKVTSFVDGRKLESELRRTDGAYWEILDFDFVEGGPFTAADDADGNFVVVINETTRERFFDGNQAVGRTLRADDQAFKVIGVVRDVPFVRELAYADIWAPLGTAKSTDYRGELLGSFRGIVLAGSRSDFPAIKEEFRNRLATAQLPDPDVFEKLESNALTRFEQIATALAGSTSVGDAPIGRFVLMVAVLVVAFMTLPALNLVNLSLSRILERSSEIGVRKAFGASSWTLVGQFLVENVVLTLAGGVLGFVLSVLVVGVVNRSGVIPYAELTVSIRVFLAGLGLSLVFAMLSGAYPAWRMSRLHPVEALHGRAL